MPPGDPEALAAALVTVARDASCGSGWARPRSDAVADYDIRRAVAEQERVYAALAGARRPDGGLAAQAGGLADPHDSGIRPLRTKLADELRCEERLRVGLPHRHPGQPHAVGVGQVAPELARWRRCGSGRAAPAPWPGQGSPRGR